MKKFLSTMLLTLTVTVASAEGFQVNTFSAKQEGMGHVGVGMKLGAESQIFNPGALAFSTNTFEVSGAVSAISAIATATHTADGVTTDYKTNNKVSTPMNVAASFRIYDNFYGGVVFYTPYGSSIKWGENWPGAILNQNVDIKVYTVQPTLSYRVLPNLSIGAGAMISWGSIDLNKGLVSASSLNAVITALGYPDAMKFNGVTPASANLTGTSALAVGYNVGALWEINKRWNLGVSFRSKTTLTVSKGDAAVSYANENAERMLGETLNNLNSTNFAASLPCPYVLTAGVAYKPIDNLTLAFDAQLNGWKAYDQLDIEFENQSDFDQHLTKNYSNAMTYHFGAQWGVTSRLDLRCGLMVDTNPCDISHYNPETPGQTRVEPSVGLSFRPIKGLSIDVAFMYVHGCGTEGATGVYDDFIAKKYPMLGLPTQNTFTADYKVRAYIPAVGFSYSF